MTLRFKCTKVAQRLSYGPKPHLHDIALMADKDGNGEEGGVLFGAVSLTVQHEDMADHFIVGRTYTLSLEPVAQ